jgi:Ca2+-binding RTX toxin-like protein
MPVINGDDNANVLSGSSSDDTINGLGGDDNVSITSGTDTIDGGAGIDSLQLVFFGAVPAPTGPVTYTLTASSLTSSSGTIDTAFSGIEKVLLLFVSGFDDTFDASAWAPAQSQDGYSLSLFMGVGDDTVIGSAYGDMINAVTGANFVDAGAGIDYVTIAADDGFAASIVLTMDGDAVVTTQGGVLQNRIVNAETVGIFPGGAMGLTIDASGIVAPSTSLLFVESAGSDTILGSVGADTFSTAGPDQRGADVYTGNGGADVYSFSSGNARSLDDTTITDFDGDDSIDLNGNDGAALYPSGPVRPLIDSFIGTAAFSGTAGEYRYSVSDGTTFVQFDSNGDGAADGTLTLASGAFALEAFDDSGLGPQTLRIAQAALSAKGTAGNDTLAGGLAGDTLRGLAGNDTLVGNWGDDSLSGDAGNDVLDGGDGNDSLTGGDGDDWLRGGAGIDAVSYAAATGGVSVSLARVSAQNTGGAGIDRLADVENAIGSAFDDVIHGSGAANNLRGGDGDDLLESGAGDDVLNGGNGNDLLNGAAGNDEMRGGAGDDVYYVDAAGDAVIEGTDAGADVVRAGIDYVLAANVEELFVGGAGRNGTGNALGNVLHGAAASNVLSGLGGDDVIRGDAGRDTIDGGAGADLIDGGAGKDTLTGGADRDVFQFRDGDFGATRALADVITDFSHADAEKIQLNLVDADTVAAGNQAFAWIGSGAFTGVAGQLHYAQAGGSTYVEGDTNGDGVADFVIALTGLHTLVAGDFVL